MLATLERGNIIEIAISCRKNATVQVSEQRFLGKKVPYNGQWWMRKVEGENV